MIAGTKESKTIKLFPKKNTKKKQNRHISRSVAQQYGLECTSG